MSTNNENKNISPLNLDEKEYYQTISFENTLNVNYPPNVNLSTKIGNTELLPNLKFEHVRLLALQAKERSKRNLKLLGKTFIQSSWGP